MILSYIFKQQPALILSGALLLAGLLFFPLPSLSANPLDTIQFPVTELGNCGSASECKAYCDAPDNIAACVTFGERQGLLNEQEVKRGKKIAELAVKRGPGNCGSERECRAYCEDINHVRECLAFGKENDLLPPEELTEAEKIVAVLDRGVKLPGGCTNKQSCEAYCEDDRNLEECIAFGETAGFVSAQEAAMVRKTGGKGPGGCKGKQACESFCQEPGNMKVCMEFAVTHDLMSEQEQEQAQGMLRALESGVQPPACRGEQECQAYCQQPEHAQECFDFALAAGFIEPQEAEQAKRMMELGITSGPGGCQDKAECEAFCNNPENQETCTEFSIKAGMVTPEQAEQMRQSGPNMMTGGPGGCTDRESCEVFCSNPDNMEECRRFGGNRNEANGPPPEAWQEQGPPDESRDLETYEQFRGQQPLERPDGPDTRWPQNDDYGRPPEALRGDPREFTDSLRQGPDQWRSPEYSDGAFEPLPRNEEPRPEQENNDRSLPRADYPPETNTYNQPNQNEEPLDNSRFTPPPADQQPPTYQPITSPVIDQAPAPTPPASPETEPTPSTQ